MPVQPNPPSGNAASSGPQTTLDDIVKRVQRRLDDDLGTYADSDYVIGRAQDAYEELYNKMKAGGAPDFDEVIVEIPSVPAGSTDLSQYSQAGQPLATLVTPRVVEWKIAGVDASNYRPADGPLDQVRDINGSGIIQLDSWAFLRRVLYLSRFINDLDLRITGDFLFDPLTAPDSRIQIAVNANTVLVNLIAEAIADARGNDKWSKKYGEKAMDGIDDLIIIAVKAQQGQTHRVSRMTKRRTGLGSISINR